MKLKAKKKELHSCCSCSKNKLVQIFRLPCVIKATKFDHFDRIGISVHKLSCLWKRFSNFLKNLSANNPNLLIIPEQMFQNDGQIYTPALGTYYRVGHKDPPSTFSIDPLSSLREIIYLHFYFEFQLTLF